MCVWILMDGGWVEICVVGYRWICIDDESFYDGKLAYFNGIEWMYGCMHERMGKRKIRAHLLACMHVRACL